MSQYFPKPYEPFGGDVNVKVDLSNYANKADIKNISHIDTSIFALTLCVPRCFILSANDVYIRH